MAIIFVNRVLHAADTKDELLIASDQFGSPTSAKDLARIILYLIKTNEYGTYHATCQGVCNRYEFAQEVLKLAGKRITLRPVVTSESDLLLQDQHMRFWIILSFVSSMYTRCRTGELH